MEASQNKYKINFVGLRLLYRNPKIKPSAKAVLVNLLLYAGIDGYSFPSEEKLAEDFGLSSRQIRNLLKQLKGTKTLEWQRGGYGRSNRYLIDEEIYFRTDEANRKSISVNSGNKFPLQNGNEVPPNISHESNQLSSSELPQQFLEANKNGLSELEKRKFERLCRNNKPDLIKESIKIAVSRGKSSFNTAYLSKMLTDWATNGKPLERPVFRPCNLNDCDNGFIFTSGVARARECSCRENYSVKVKEWKKEWG